MDHPEIARLEQRLKALEAMSRASLLGPDKVFTFPAEDEEVHFWFPYAATDSLQQKVMAVGAFYEYALLKKIKSMLAGAVVLDCGANIGNHSVYFAKFGRAQIVHAYEPQRLVMKMLRRNVELNNLGEVVFPERLVLGEHDGTAALTDSRSKNLGATSFHEGGDYRMTSIDALGIRPDFIKIDVEGAQMSVLRGAESTLDQHKPILWIELREKLNEFQEANEHLVKMGYRSAELDRNNFLFRPD